jgi:pseudaminic acid biosynthesis-associated methylase
MIKATEQIKRWAGNFGKKYTKRNALTLNKLNKLYKRDYGITRTELNNLFLNKFNRNIKILEVGSNIGNQLLLLQKMGFKNLYGIEINNYAVELSKFRTKNISIIQGSMFDIPFKDKYFDFVFTSGVLIHINPKDLKKALKEIYRCSRRYIWGFEYYSKKTKDIIYRGEKNLLWEANFPKIYTDSFPDLRTVKIKFLKYLKNENIDVMFLVKKL